MAKDRGQWTSRTGFILAAAGSAVGLGNIWKFPYITGENGGGLFVLIYLVCIAIVGIPIMMAEIMIGRAAQAQPVVAFEKLQGRKTGWAAVGWMGVLAGFVILSYYIVVAGWAMDFTLKSIVNITAPIHDTAAVEGSAYRATTPTEQMRATLIQRKAGKDLKFELEHIKRQARPSVWDDDERYAKALEDAGVVDVGRARLLAEVWADQPPDVREAVGMADVAETTFDEEVLSAYDSARVRLFEDEHFAANITLAETITRQVEQRRKEGLLDAKAHYDAMDDVSIHDEAESVKRRAVIYNMVSTAFIDVAGDGWTSTFWSAVFMLLVVLIVAGGISNGIERTCMILMPMLFVLILVMVFYGMFQEGFGEAVRFVFKPDPSKLKASGVLEALGHAFFTLSLGMGAMITYGSYQKSKGGLMGESATIAILDTAIALLACLMIFPIIFSYDQAPAAGPGLVFMSMPLAFAEIGRGGMLLAILFFGLLVFAALTSAISLLEVVASYFIDQLGWTRKRAAWLLGGVIFLFGVASAFAMDPGFVMSGWAPSYGKNFFDTMDYLASNWMLPMGGLFISIYAGWVMPRKFRDAELVGLSPIMVHGWLLLVRFVAPALVIVVLAQKVGMLDADELMHGLFN